MSKPITDTVRKYFDRSQQQKKNYKNTNMLKIDLFDNLFYLFLLNLKDFILGVEISSVLEYIFQIPNFSFGSICNITAKWTLEFDHPKKIQKLALKRNRARI